MVIYNNKKEFLGIDEENLRSLGFFNLADLQSEAADFGDLFVKTPGYVHNFKHVHWIDFVLCEEDKNASKAIIHAKGKNFNCILEIKTIYLTSSPNSKAYIINLTNLRNLSLTETSDISSELQTRDIPVAAIPKTEEFEETQKIEIEKVPIKEIKTKDIIQPTPIEKIIIDDPYEINDDLSLDSYELSQEQLDEIGEPDSAIEINPIQLDESKEELIEEKEEDNKKICSNFDIDKQNINFDINKTAEILEMDVATIEDFVNDFITQAKEFESKLYNSIEQEDLIVLKGLSHQLKGVAANLRIHDCQDILIKINKADDLTTSKADLDTFYKLITKLSGEEVTNESVKTNEPKTDAPIINEIQDVNEIDEDEDVYILEINETLSTQTKNEDKTDSLKIEDDYVLEVNETLSTQTKNENQADSLKMNDFGSLNMKQSELIKKQDNVNEIEMNKEEFSIDIESEELSLEPDSELEIDEPKEFNNQESEELSEPEELENKAITKYDKTKTAVEIGLDEQSFNELFQDYIDESQDLVSTIQEAIDNDDSTDWRHSTIKLKGMSDNMRINSFISELETIISTDDKASAQNALKQLEISLSQIINTKD